jgi:hypothetical protein
MSYVMINIDLGDIAHEIAFQPGKVAALLNEVANRCDGDPDDEFVLELIEDLDPATKTMIITIAKAIEAKSGGGT